MADLSTLTLDEIETAIRKILVGGQEFNIKGKNIRFADLKQLQALRDAIKTESVQAENAAYGGLTQITFNH